MTFRDAYVRFLLWDERDYLPQTQWVLRGPSGALVDHFPIAAVAAVSLVAPLDELADDGDLRDALRVFALLVSDWEAIPMQRWRDEMRRWEPTAEALLRS